MWPSLIAVLGTLAGGSLAFVYQARLARTARHHANADRLHAELLEACSALGAALVAYRHSQLARQTHLLRTQETSESLREEVRARRGDAWAAFFRVELLTRNERVLGEAGRCMAQIRELKYLEDLARLDADAELARQSIHAFVQTARDNLIAAEHSA
jgi:hypothetical protein